MAAYLTHLVWPRLSCREKVSTKPTWNTMIRCLTECFYFFRVVQRLSKVNNLLVLQKVSSIGIFMNQWLVKFLYIIGWSNMLDFNSKSFSLHTISLTWEAKLWEDTRDCLGKRRVNVGYRIDCHQGSWEGRNFHCDFTELCWTGHEAAKIVIFEAETAMRHTTSAQVQNAGIWRTWAFPAQWANYICSENIDTQLSLFTKSC